VEIPHRQQGAGTILISMEGDLMVGIGANFSSVD
jgi:hypothetical protein